MPIHQSIACVALLAGLNLQASPKVTVPPAKVRTALKLDAFYKKHVDVGGFSIVSSKKVSDYALLEAAYLIGKMLGGRQDILEAMAKNKVRFAIMAHNEYTTQIPEHSDLQPRHYWNKRARGLGATPERPAPPAHKDNSETPARCKSPTTPSSLLCPKGLLGHRFTTWCVDGGGPRPLQTRQRDRTDL